MAFYDLSKIERYELNNSIQEDITSDFIDNTRTHILNYFSDEDTYIRKAAYLAVGRIYSSRDFQKQIINTLLLLSKNGNEKIRQTIINAAGEIGKSDFKVVQVFFDRGLFDHHHSVRNAVIGSLKKMSEKNPIPTLNWAKTYLVHPDLEIRSEVCHGIELRGRTHPEDILPLLEVLQFDKIPRVRNTLIHVLGQISYKKNCLPTVIAAFNSWKDNPLIQDAIDEIIDVHSEKRYAKFSALTQHQVIDYIENNLKK